MENQNNNTNRSIFNSIQELVTCYICMSKIVDLSICPQCQKCACYKCLLKWLNDNNKKCPHCRTYLKETEIIKLKILNNISDNLETLFNFHILDNICKIHGIHLNYFCIKCNLELCSDCIIFNEIHKDHFDSINHLDKIYKERIEKINNQIDFNLTNKREIIKQNLDTYENMISNINKNKEIKFKEIDVFTKNIKIKYDSIVNNRLLKLLNSKNQANYKLDLIDLKIKEFKNSIEESTSNFKGKFSIIKNSDTIISKIKEINTDSDCMLLEKYKSENIDNIEIPEDIIPRYEETKMKINNFIRIFNKNNKHNAIINDIFTYIYQNNEFKECDNNFFNQSIITSLDNNNNNYNNNNKLIQDIAFCNKSLIYLFKFKAYYLNWRIKIYPNGNSTALNSHMSMYLELLDDIDTKEPFEYEFQLGKHTNKKEIKNRFFTEKQYLYSKKFSETFSNSNKIWGINKFITLEELLNINNSYFDKNGNLYINILIRPKSTLQVLYLQNNYINYLESLLTTNDKLNMNIENYDVSKKSLNSINNKTRKFNRNKLTKSSNHKIILFPKNVNLRKKVNSSENLGKYMLNNLDN